MSADGGESDRLTICSLQAPVRHTVSAILRPAYPPSANEFNEREQSPRQAQKVESTVTVVNIGRMNDHAQQEAQRVDQDVPLATLDLLARVVARRIERRPPFEAFAVCVSMIATVGLASRPCCSRTATYSS
jgi:hypothetical protein